MSDSKPSISIEGKTYLVSDLSEDALSLAQQVFAARQEIDRQKALVSVLNAGADHLYTQLLDQLPSIDTSNDD